VHRTEIRASRFCLLQFNHANPARLVLPEVELVFPVFAVVGNDKLRQFPGLRGAQQAVVKADVIEPAVAGSAAGCGVVTDGDIVSGI